MTNSPKATIRMQLGQSTLCSRGRHTSTTAVFSLRWSRCCSGGGSSVCSEDAMRRLTSCVVTQFANADSNNQIAKRNDCVEGLREENPVSEKPEEIITA